MGDRFLSAQAALNVLSRMPTARRKKRPKPQRSKLPVWTALVGGICSVLLASWIVNANKWLILGTVGLKPRGLCSSDSSILDKYLRQGGDPNMLVEKQINLIPTGMRMSKNARYKVPLLICAPTAEVIAILLKHGADPDHDLEGIPILHYAISVGNNELAQQLINNGSEINFSVKYVQGDEVYEHSLLHRAIEIGNSDVVKALIEQGAEINAPGGKFGETPLDVARRLYRVEIGKFLESNGAIANKYDARW